MIDIFPEDYSVAKVLEIRDWIKSQPWSDLAHVPAEEEPFNEVYNFNVSFRINLHIYSPC
jgi:hypothetical protein